MSLKERAPYKTTTHRVRFSRDTVHRLFRHEAIQSGYDAPEEHLMVVLTADGGADLIWSEGVDVLKELIGV